MSSQEIVNDFFNKKNSVGVLMSGGGVLHLLTTETVFISVAK